MLVSAMRVPPVFLADVHVLGAALGDGHAVEEVPFSSPVTCDPHAYVCAMGYMGVLMHIVGMLSVVCASLLPPWMVYMC